MKQTASFRFPMFILILLGTVCLSLTIALVPTRSQDNGSPLTGTLNRSKDWFVIYIAAPSDAHTNVKLRDVQFNLQPSNTTIRFDQFESAFGLNFDGLAVPACLRLQRENTQGAYPSDCSSSGVRRYSVSVADADVFWYDNENGRNFTLNIIGAAGNSFDCSTSQTDCSFDIPVALSATPIPTKGGGATPLPTGDSIVVSRNKDLYIVDHAGKNEIRLTNTPNISEGYPSWSHSGQYIIYEALGQGEANSKLYRMNADGTGSTRMTTGSGADWIPEYSPDDTKILYSSTSNSVDQIWVMNADGSGQTNLTGVSSVHNMEGDWSPDGKHIVFTSNRTGKYEIWTMDADGQNPQQLTYNGGGCYFPSWSPDGQYIVFMGDVGGGGYDLYTIELGGNDRYGNRITFNPRAINSQPHWSPDGQFIVYSAKVNTRDFAVFVTNREGKGDPNPITMGWEPSWGSSSDQ